MKYMGFGDMLKRKEQGICATCGKQVGEFRDELSRREFKISGMCQECQDEVFEE